MKIRKYKTSEARALLSLFYDTVHEVNIKHYSEAQVEAWMPSKEERVGYWNERFLNSNTWVAESKGVILGFINLEKSGTAIDMLYVHKDFQRKGVATALLKKVEKKLKQKGITHWTVEASITARPFFEKNGYRLVRENHKILNDMDFLNYIMEKELKSKKQKTKKKDKEKFQWGNLALNKLFDLLIVIVGVSVAFQLNNWKMNRDEKEMEKFYLQSLSVDLDSDITYLTEILESIEHDQAQVKKYLQESNDSTNNTDLGEVIFDVLSLENFTQHQNTYQTLLQGNGLSVLSDAAMRSQITDYYSSYTSIDRFEKVYTDVLFKVHEYMSPYCNYETKEIVNYALLKNHETRNFMIIVLSQLDDGTEAYERAIEKGVQLKEDLSK
jgi:putative acetyltransferase